MKILVYGAGRVGSVFGGFLSREHDVTLLGRKKHLTAIQKKGLLISGIWGRHHFRRFHLKTHPRNLSKQNYDLILVTVKASDTARSARELKKIAGPKSTLLILQNGLGNIETFKRVFPEKKLLAGRVIFGAKIIQPGHVKVTVMANPTAIGEVSTKQETLRVKKIAALFQKAGVPCVPAKDIQSVLWGKVIYNCALNPLASLLKCHYGYLMEHELTRLVMNEVVCEIFDVARKYRVSLIPKTPEAYQRLFYSALVPKTYDHHPSMLQDLEAGKKTEIEALNGAIARLGKNSGVATPVNRMLAALIREKERA